MVAYASTHDLSDELGQPHPDDEVTLAQWRRWIQTAENRLRARIPNLDALAADEPYRSLIVDVEVAAVTRKVLNPQGLASTTVSVDDGSLTERRREEFSGGDIRITDEEWALLMPAQRRAFTVRPQWG